MKKLPLLFTFIIILFSSTGISFAQAYQNGWGFGFGLSYPRFFSADIVPLESNYGGYLSIQRNFSENVALRLLANYSYMEGTIKGGSYYYKSKALVPGSKETMHTDLVSSNLELLYYLVPCAPVDPYVGAGLAVSHFEPKWPGSIINPEAKAHTTAQFNFTLGSEWKLSTNWKMITEFGVHTIDGELDGIVNNNREGAMGSNTDGYITFSLGTIYYFARGPKSKCCDMYSGITEETHKTAYPTLAQIDSLVKAHIPKEVEKQVVVEKQVTNPFQKQSSESKNWVINGVNFKNNSSELLPESCSTLDYAVKVLKDNPYIRVEIQGYTDNIGKDESNQKLSETRANTVKEYLIQKGINAMRLTAVGYGKANPIGDNSTEEGKAQNRRIQFKVVK